MRLIKAQQAYYYNRSGKKELAPLKPGDQVRIQPEPGSKLWKQAIVVDHHSSPRSYIVDTGNQRLRRNRVALRSDSGRREPKQLKNSENSTAKNSHHLDMNPNNDVNTTLIQCPEELYHNDTYSAKQQMTLIKNNKTTPTKGPEKEDSETGLKHYITRSGRISRRLNKLNI